MRKAEEWTRDHIARTEDIYPAMAYGILALSSLGHSNDDPTIQKALSGLKRFQQKDGTLIHQQCCISPNWDTPWAAVALLEAGLAPDDPSLLKAARYMISKEVKDFRGDWAVKNPKGPAGGWAFEFENDYFPDVDDTIEAVHFLRRVDLPESEKSGPIDRSIAWMLSMQCKNGGWAAFDKNNVSQWVNKIPFSDHGACLLWGGLRRIWPSSGP
jgi:squalene-hopene/tetraprenyl-beta-curcumene cyclase